MLPIAFGMPSLLELVFIGLLLGVPTLIAAIVVILATRRRTTIPPSVNPKLMPCPDCRQTVSRLAPTCPHCGRPLASEETVDQEVPPPSC